LFKPFTYDLFVTAVLGNLYSGELWPIVREQSKQPERSRAKQQKAQNEYYRTKTPSNFHDWRIQFLLGFYEKTASPSVLSRMVWGGREFCHL
jgi:hypothetical protein